MTGTDNRFSLTNEQLKVIAVVTMTIDHIGAYLLPQYDILRIVGRISFPLFAFMVGQGCIHTKNIYKYLARMTAFAVVTQIVLLPFQPFYNLNIMFTFVLSVAVAVVIKKWHNILQNGTAPQKTVAVIFILTAVAAVYIICTAADVEYGFWGCMLAPAAFAGGYLKRAKHSNTYTNQISAFAVVLVLLCFSSYSIQNWSILSVLLLCLYNGRKTGKIPKNFFYIYYPLHLVIIHILNTVL
ncbi:MAG: hypothetical protein IKV52_00510 [Oscillospiraceae bacterium]|nr:hypothetical protein [Oscillospiraceae bacterium]